MKHLVFLLAFIATAVTAEAQIPRGNYGTLQPYSSYTGKLYNNSFTNVTTDTLKGVDTSYIYFALGNPYYHLIDLTTVQKADSFSGTATLQGRASSSDAGYLTYSTGWQSLAASTTTCTACPTTTKTFTLQTGTSNTLWDLGKTTFQYFRLVIIGTRSTDTTAVSAKSIYSY